MGIPGSRYLFVLLMAVLPVFLLVSAVGAQGIQTSPYSAPSMLRGSSGQGLGPDPSNLPGLPGIAGRGQPGSDTVSLCSGMFQGILPPIPNLQFGYLLQFRAGRWERSSDG